MVSWAGLAPATLLSGEQLTENTNLQNVQNQYFSQKPRRNRDTVRRRVRSSANVRARALSVSLLAAMYAEPARRTRGSGRSTGMGVI